MFFSLSAELECRMTTESSKCLSNMHIMENITYELQIFLCQNEIHYKFHFFANVLKSHMKEVYTSILCHPEQKFRIGTPPSSDSGIQAL